MAGGEDETLEERLKAALWFSVGKIVDEETFKLGVNATPQFIGALMEMIWAQIGRQSRPRLATWDRTLTTDPGNVSEDLQSFARSVMPVQVCMQDVRRSRLKMSCCSLVETKNWLQPYEASLVRTAPRRPRSPSIDEIHEEKEAGQSGL
ncbi:MAG: hypothetical protein Q9212_002760 [Teloschistes hypoglaucus]